MRKDSLSLIILGFAALAVVMGIGRFAFTPLFPYMNDLSSSSAGLLATANYTGYFAGAWIARSLSPNKERFLFYLWINIMTTILMGFTASLEMWLLLRLSSGVTSAIIFVFISGWIAQEVQLREGKNRNGIIFGGVGFGIFLSGMLIPFLLNTGSSSTAWVTLGIISALLSARLYRVLPDSPVRRQPSTITLTNTASRRSIIGLYICYFCEGFGYIIFGTFIVALLSNHESLPVSPAIVWAITGFAAIPSCLIWMWLRNYASTIRILTFAYLIQICSIVLSSVSGSLIFIIISGIGFGGTFMGITVLSIELARELQPDAPQPLIAGITAGYAIGQLLGPLLASLLYTGGSYTPAFLFAATILLIGLVTLLLTYQETKTAAAEGKSAV